jgi:hypothetical protein
MIDILKSIAPVVKQAQHVKINQEGLANFCSEFKDTSTSFKAPFTSFPLNPQDKVQLDLAYNAVNFCYWGNPKWTISYQGNEVGGAYGMKAAFNRALKEGFPILDSSYLETISEEEFAQITRGNITVPLFKERVQFLRQLGSILNRAYDGKATKVIEAGKGDAIELLGEMARSFPCYYDGSMYGGEEVLFFKRAQLFIDNVHKLQIKQGKGLSSIERLTALADYKVPQILRDKGVLEYSPELSHRINNYQVIPAGSMEEVEIRAFTLDAIEQMVQRLKLKLPSLTAIDLDKFLYLESKKPSLQDKPYHRTLTTAY